MNHTQNHRLPSITHHQSASLLHSHNKRVTLTCLAHSQAEDQTYLTNKQHYQQAESVRQEQRSKAVEEAEMALRKSLEGKRKSHEQHNKENLHKLERALADRRNKLARQEKQHMELSAVRKQQQRGKHALTQHHSSDPFRKRLREQAEMGYSLILLQQQQQKAQAAHERRQKQMDESMASKLAKQHQQAGSALQRSREKDYDRQKSELHRIIQKYQGAGGRIAAINASSHKSAGEKHAELQKALDLHRKQRSKAHEEEIKHIETDVHADLARLNRAESLRQLQKATQVAQLQGKRREKQRTFLNNSSSLREEAERKASVLLQRHHDSSLKLTNAKAQRELTRCSNLQDSFLTAIRS